MLSVVAASKASAARHSLFSSAGNNMLAGQSVSYRNPLVAGLAFAVLPRDVEYVGFDLARHRLQAFQLVAAAVHGLAVNPSPVRQDRTLYRHHRLHGVELYVSPRGAAGRLFVLQEDGQHLDHLA